jgi:hypothetical protein
MRAITVTCFIAASLSVSCMTHVGDVPAYGAVWAVFRDDFRAAAAACQRNFPKDYTGCSIRSIDVAGHNTLEVSIGHALICDAIYLGFENTVQLYKRQLL